MGFVRDFSRGIRAYGKAISLLFSSKLWYFMLFPVVIVIVLFVAGNYAVGYLGDGLSGVIEAKMTEWIEGISWLEWVSGVAGFLVKLLTRFLYYILFISFGGYVVMVVMSPVYSWLSERTEAIVSGRGYDPAITRDDCVVFRFFYSFGWIGYACTDLWSGGLFLRVRFYGLCRGEKAFPGKGECSLYAT